MIQRINRKPPRNRCQLRDGKIGGRFLLPVLLALFDLRDFLRVTVRLPAKSLHAAVNFLTDRNRRRARKIHREEVV